MMSIIQSHDVRGRKFRIHEGHEEHESRKGQLPQRWKVSKCYLRALRALRGLQKGIYETHEEHERNRDSFRNAGKFQNAIFVPFVPFVDRKSRYPTHVPGTQPAPRATGA